MEFEKEYWDKNYSSPKEMDGIGNVKDHIRYLHSLFELEGVEVNSIIDFGFGKGVLFDHLLKKFKPYRAHGIEPSRYIFDKYEKKSKERDYVAKLKLFNTDLNSWCEKQKPKSKRFDLGVCTSVFQYLSEEEIDRVLPVMARMVKYLYFSVPTDKELDRQISELDFKDEYAIRRKREWYHRKISPHFSFVSTRVLESKTFFTEKNTLFSELLFRF